LVEINYTPPSLNSTSTKGNIGTIIQLIGQLLSKSNIGIQDKYVEFWINGKYIGTNKTNENGIVIYNYIFNAEGNYNLQLLFKED